MHITPLASGSSGNAYLISDGQSTLLLDAGIPYKQIQIGTSFRISELAGVLITHEHRDHCKAVPELVRNGVDVYALPCVFDSLKVIGHRCHSINECDVRSVGVSGGYLSIKIGTFWVFPFNCQHDVPNIGYYIHSNNTGENLLYITDSYYVKFTFPELNYIMAEANYSREAMNESIDDGRIPLAMKKRLVQSHMSIDTLIQMLKANDLSKVKQIYLLHLSNNNSDEREFKERVQRAVGCEVYVC